MKHLIAALLLSFSLVGSAICRKSHASDFEREIAMKMTIAASAFQTGEM